MRVFVDTNIIISAILFPNAKVAKVFSHVIEKHMVIIASYIKEECKEVFEKKFPLKKEQLNIFFDGIRFEEFKTPEKIDEKKYPEIRDIKDLPVLVSAILSDSDILITFGTTGIRAGYPIPCETLSTVPRRSRRGC